MDIRLREIAGGPAGTYFIVTDNSTVETITEISNLRLVPINVESGPVNTIVVFQKGDTAGFTAIFGKGLRKHEKQGNYSVKACLEMLAGGPLAVMNLRAFDSVVDVIGINGLSPNKTIPETITTGYQNVFNVNGLWTPKPKNISDKLVTNNLLNFANIGKGELTYFVTVSKNAESLTDQYAETLASTDLVIDDFPALKPEIIVGDTFVDVWIFNNTFDNATISTNQYYGHLFNQAGLINFEDVEALSAIKESGFNRKITGSLIPFFKNELDEDISIDTLVNAVYAETGLLAYINDDVLEDETIDNGLSIINTTAKGYYDVTGSNIGLGNLLSHRLQPETPVVITNINSYVAGTDLTKKPLVSLQNNLFSVVTPNELENPTLFDYGNRIVVPYNIGIRGGDVMFFEDKDSSELIELLVKSVELTGNTFVVTAPEVVCSVLTPAFNTIDVSNSTPKLNVVTPTATGILKYQLFKKKSTDSVFTLLVDNFEQYVSSNEYTDLAVEQNLKYHYVLLAVGDAEHSSVFGSVYEYTLNSVKTAVVVTPVLPIPDGNVSKNKIIIESVLTLNGNVNADIIVKRLTPKQNGLSKLQFTSLSAYVPRVEQFTNGSATRQSEVLDVLNSPSVLKGLKNFGGIRYLVDPFKSFVEGGYKSQFGQLAYELDKCNKFVRCIINEPFIEDLEKSINPLFKQSPDGVFDLTYLKDGGNTSFSTRFLNKFTIGSDLCFFFGSGIVTGPNVSVIAPKVSNAFISKTFAWDVVANTSGYIDGISAIEINPDTNELKAMESFRWNPIIKKSDGFTIYGNTTGIKTRSALQQVHNSELLAYIKESLFNMSQSENFKKGTYDEYLRLETQVQSFMDALALQGAIQPNPVVICNASNNTTEVSKQKIKVCRVEYFNINALDKVVFDLQLN